MQIELKEFQVDAVAQLATNFALAQTMANTGKVAAVLLNAPTGSGKTLMATALIDQLLAGDELGWQADPDLVFLWLTDDPELNVQSVAKMVATSSVLTSTSLHVVDAETDSETFTRGTVHFLNTQKLASNTSYVKNGDGREFTLWEMVTNTVAVDRARFVLIIDEAHRGARGKAATEAETIMQRFMMGGDEVESVPLVIGISATPERFEKLCNETARPVLKVDVPPEQVRESGLLKEFVDLYHPDEKQPSQVTMLLEAIAAWQEYSTRWASYGATLEEEEAPEPILLIQVEDAKAGSEGASKTDLDLIVRTLVQQLSPAGEDWLAHAFQDRAELTIDSTRVRHIRPSMIDADPHVKVVLFKTSLNTGWDCPRAETMVSFRPAKDDVGIAQLVGRMVRAPLTRRVDDDEHLNTVALYLPYYDADTVKKVISRLTGQADGVPATQVREGRTATTLKLAKGTEACVEAMEKLPTYTIPRPRSSKPIPRLAKLASLLRDLDLEKEPVKGYRTKLVDVLLAELRRLSREEAFKGLATEAQLLELRRQRVAVSGDETPVSTTSARAVVADPDLDLLHADSGRMLGEGLHKEYLRRRVVAQNVDPRTAKIELAALVQFPEVLQKVSDAADEIRAKWIADHKVAINTSSDKHRQTLRDIEGSGAEPALTTVVMPPLIEGIKSSRTWDRHIYVDPKTENYPATFKSSWEIRALESELENPEIVGWLRNPDRKPWSICVPRRDGTRHYGVYPDFIFFRATKSGVIADIIDPHLLNDKDAPTRAAALAQYAGKHSDVYGRIEMLIYESDKDMVGKRIDLMNKKMRDRVVKVTTHPHLKDIFDNP